MVRTCWEKAGFAYMKNDGIFHLLVNDGKIPDSPEFQEGWRINYLVEELPARRRGQLKTLATGRLPTTGLSIEKLAWSDVAFRRTSRMDCSIVLRLKFKVYVREWALLNRQRSDRTYFIAGFRVRAADKHHWKSIHMQTIWSLR
jgi:hypothetical protein